MRPFERDISKCHVCVFAGVLDQANRRRYGPADDGPAGVQRGRTLLPPLPARRAQLEARHQVGGTEGLRPLPLPGQHPSTHLHHSQTHRHR